MTDPLQAALDLIARRIPVFPCNPDNKQPLTRRGFIDASLDESQVRAWWNEHGGKVLWGVPTGRRSGLAVFDVDIDGIKGIDGYATLRERGTAPPRTRAHLTPRGGMHLIYALADGECCPSDAGVLGRGLDRRGDGGYFIWWPAHGGTVIDDRAPVAAPDWLTTPRRGSADGVLRAVTEGEARELIEGWLAEVAGAVEGERNATLSRCAFGLGQMVEAGFAREDDASRFIAAGVALGMDDGEPERVVAKGVERGRAHPSYESVDAAVLRAFGRPIEWIKRGLFSTFGELTSQPRPIEWLIDDVLPKHGIAMLFGQPGAGKSYMAVDLALSVACGREWNGRGVTRCNVAYITGEGHHGIPKRLLAWRLDRDVAAIADTAFIASNQAIALNDPTGAEKLYEALDAAGGLWGLFVIDTVTASAPGSNTNDAVDMGVYVKNCQALAARYGAAMLWIHHSGRMDHTRSKGAVELFGAVDIEYGLIAEEGRTGRVRMFGTKFKDTDPQADMWFRFRNANVPWFDARGNQEHSSVFDPCEPPGDGDAAGAAKRYTASASDLLLMDCLGCDPIDHSAVRAAFMAQHPGASTGARRKAFDRSWDKAIDRGWCEVAEDGLSVTPVVPCMQRDRADK